MAKKDANEQMTESAQARAEPQPRKAADNIHISGIALDDFHDPDAGNLRGSHIIGGHHWRLDGAVL